MITIKSNKLVNALNKGEENKSSSLSLGDLIDLYAQIMMDENDMIDDKTLQKLLCKQTSSYCDFDPAVQESSKVISGAKRSTEDIIAAVKSNDNNALDMAFGELQGYQKRISELEQTLHTDELTHFLNRRYLMSEKLENGKILRESGVLFLFRIDYFKQINEKYGYAIGDKILKFCARSISSVIDPKKYEIIRFSGAVFVIMAKEEQTSVIERKLEGFKNTLQGRPVKISDGEKLRLSFSYGYEPYKAGEEFDHVFATVSNILNLHLFPGVM